MGLSINEISDILLRSVLKLKLWGILDVAELLETVYFVLNEEHRYSPSNKSYIFVDRHRWPGSVSTNSGFKPAPPAYMLTLPDGGRSHHLRNSLQKSYETGKPGNPRRP